MILARAMVFLALVGCASGGKKQIDLDSLTNEDFKKPAPERYRENEDYFRKVSMENAQALKDESLYRLKDFDGSVDSEDTVTKIIKMCYEGDFEDAFALVSKEHDRYRDNPSFWNQVGTCHFLKGNKRKALLFYNKALEYRPSFSPALNNIGVMYRKDGEDQKAEVAFSRAIESSNFAKTPRFNLAQLYLDYGLFNRALAHLRVLEKSKDVDVYAGLGSAYLMAGEAKRAAAYFDKIDPDFLERPYIGINAALAYFEAGDREKAKDVLDDIDKDELGPFKNYFKESAEKVGL